MSPASSSFIPGQSSSSSSLATNKIPPPKVTESPVFLTPISEPQLANWAAYNPNQQSSIYSATMAGVPATEIPSTSHPVMSNFQEQNLYEPTGNNVLSSGNQMVSVDIINLGH